MKMKQGLSVVITRTILGAMLLFFGMNDWHQLMGKPELSIEALNFINSLKQTGYLYDIIKFTEFLAAFCLVGGFFVPLATLMIFPILLNILLFHLFLDPQGLIIAIIMFTSGVYILWSYRTMLIWLFKYNASIDPNSFYDHDVLVEHKGS